MSLQDRIANTVVIDFETNSGAVEGNLTDIFCVGFQFASDAQAKVIHFDSRDFDSYRDYLEEHVLPGHTPVFHNASFDLWVMQMIGVDVDTFHDTMVISYLVNPGGQHGLRAWGEYFKFPKGEIENYDSGFSEELERYCARDVELTTKVFTHLLEKLSRDEDLLHCYYTIDLPFVKSIIELNHNGVLIDKDKWEVVIQNLTEERNKVMSKMMELVPVAPGKKVRTVNERKEDTVCSFGELVEGKFVYLGFDKKSNKHTYQKIEVFNPGSDDQLAWALSTLYDWKPTKFSDKTSKPTVNKEVLSELEYPLAQLALEFSRLDKLVSTYGEGLVSQAGEDGRLRADFNNCVTLTGRLSSSKPNLQNIPSKGEMGDTLRSMFIAPEGSQLVGIDIDAFQLRIFAWYLFSVAGDANLWNEFNTNEDADPHMVTAKLLGVERKIGKTINFATLFGAGAGKVAAQLGITKEQAQVYMNKLNEAFPAIDELRQFVAEAGVFIHSLYGRRGVYYEAKSKDKGEAARAKRQAFNFVIQATEADLIKLWINIVRVQIDKLGIQAKLVLQVHDEFIFECVDTHVELLMTLLNELINSDYWLPGLRLKAAAKCGRTWLEVH